MDSHNQQKDIFYFLDEIQKIIKKVDSSLPKLHFNTELEKNCKLLEQRENVQNGYKLSDINLDKIERDLFILNHFQPKYNTEHFQKWWYLDQEGFEQGPFGKEDMKSLFSRLIIHSGTGIKNYSKTGFTPLRDMVRRGIKTFFDVCPSLKELEKHDYQFSKMNQKKNPEELDDLLIMKDLDQKLQNLNLNSKNLKKQEKDIEENTVFETAYNASQVTGRLPQYNVQPAPDFANASNQPSMAIFSDSMDRNLWHTQFQQFSPPMSSSFEQMPFLPMPPYNQPSPLEQSSSHGAWLFSVPLGTNVQNSFAQKNPSEVVNKKGVKEKKKVFFKKKMYKWCKENLKEIGRENEDMSVLEDCMRIDNIKKIKETICQAYKELNNVNEFAEQFIKQKQFYGSNNANSANKVKLKKIKDPNDRKKVPAKGVDSKKKKKRSSKKKREGVKNKYKEKKTM